MPLYSKGIDREADNDISIVEPSEELYTKY